MVSQFWSRHNCRTGRKSVDKQSSNEGPLAMLKSWVGTITPPGVLNYQEEECRNDFQVGRAAFQRNWPYVWALANGDQSAVKGQVGVAYLPEGEGPNASHAACLGGWQLMLSAYSKHKD